jgi:TubC N-terminal docking domain
MSAALRLLSECSAAGVELYLDNGRLRYRARVGIYTEALRQKVAAHKSELIALIQAQGRPCPESVEGQARIYETAHSNPAESSGDLQHSAVQQRGVHQISVASGHAGQRDVAGTAEAPQAGAPATPTRGRAADVSFVESRRTSCVPLDTGGHRTFRAPPKAPSPGTMPPPMNVPR